MARAGDWWVLDLPADPTPGDPPTVGRFGLAWAAFADEVESAERGVRSLATDGAVLTWIGAAGAVFTEAIGAFPADLASCADSYRRGAAALRSWSQDLTAAQDQADRALAAGRVARADLEAARATLASASGVADAADREVARVEAVAVRYAGSPPPSAHSPLDPEQVRSAVRTAQVAQARVAAARSQVADAQSRLDAARRMALDAQGMREDRGRVAARAIDDAAAAGIPPAGFWQNLKEVAGQVWDGVIVVAKVAVVVLGIVALIIGGPIAWVVLGAALLLLADALYKYSQGEATRGDLAWALIGCIPGTRGLTTLKALNTAFRSGGTLAAAGHVLSAGRTAVAGMASSVRAAAGNVRTAMGSLLRAEARLGDVGAVTLPRRLPPSLLNTHPRGAGPRLQMTHDVVHEVARTYDVDLQGVRVLIDKARAGFYGLTRPDQTVVLTRSAFRNEEQLARTLAHERYHVEQLRQGMGYPETYDAGNAWERAAKEFEDAWWAEHPRNSGGPR